MKALLIYFICSSLLFSDGSSLLDNSVPVFTGVTLGNKNVDPSYFKGKVTLINFWSLGCRPCLQEMPFLAQLDTVFPDSAFQILSIAPHSRERLAAYNSDLPSRYSGFRKACGAKMIKYDVLPECEVTIRSPTDDDEHLTLSHDSDEISKLFNVDMYPTTFVVDKSGTIRYFHSGYPMGSSDSLYKLQLMKEIESLCK